jgi:hypothetical protein
MDRGIGYRQVTDYCYVTDTYLEKAGDVAIIPAAMTTLDELADRICAEYDSSRSPTSSQSIVA